MNKLAKFGFLIWFFNVGMFFDCAMHNLLKGQLGMMLFNLGFLAFSVVNGLSSLEQRDRAVAKSLRVGDAE